MDVTRLSSQFARTPSGLPAAVRKPLPEVLAVPARLPAPEDQSNAEIDRGENSRNERINETASGQSQANTEKSFARSRALTIARSEIFTPSRGVSAPYLAQQIAQAEDTRVSETSPRGHTDAISAYRQTLGLTAIVLGLEGTRERRA
ncbi:MAG: hypothetical protein EP348_06850 [Alphaproteobacteria bacterium]|nr:MAG: hypothetical protein EP348_06850 [Alphaproteobacteria bacterium]